MIKLQENYPVDIIGPEAHDNVEEHNRVMSNLKLLVQSMLENGKDAVGGIETKGKMKLQLLHGIVVLNMQHLITLLKIS